MTDFDQTRWIQFKNNSEDTIPAYGVFRITGSEFRSEGQVALIAEQVANVSYGEYGVNGPLAVADQAYGNGTLDNFALALTEGTPAIDEIWGVAAGQWSLQKNYPGFVSLGGAAGSGSTRRGLFSRHLHEAFGQIQLSTTGYTHTISGFKTILWDTDGAESNHVTMDTGSGFDLQVEVRGNYWCDVSFTHNLSSRSATSDSTFEFQVRAFLNGGSANLLTGFNDSLPDPAVHTAHATPNAPPVAHPRWSARKLLRLNAGDAISIRFASSGDTHNFFIGGGFFSLSWAGARVP